MSTKTSIILCTYYEVYYIKNTVEQIQKIIPNLELIIVDDNSTDGTQDIINQINEEKKIPMDKHA
jgi:glycosyltransferase involved in cell wall biosynthesis